jgi:5-methylcytosine-specific restriction endonuclease McrA
MSRWSADSRWYRKAKVEYLAAHPTCWICGHGGADQIDHLIPVSKAPDLAMVVANWRPAHGVRGCATCPPTVSADKRRHGQPRRCNQARGNRPPTPSSPRSRRW